MDTHELKCWPEYFQAVADGSKPFEVRKKDRDYKVGDILDLYEFDPNKEPGERYTGKGCLRVVTYILEGGNFGVEAGYVVLGLSLPEFI